MLLHLPGDQALVALMTLLPIIAYPFLPSVGRSGVRCEIFLIWPSLLIAALITTIRTIDLGSGKPVFGIQLWQAILNFLSALAAIQGLRVPSSREPKPKGFSYTAEYLPVFFTYVFLKLFDDVFLLKPAEVSWLFYLLRLLMVSVGIVTMGFIVFLYLTDLATAMLFKFITRGVPCWYWLPENGAAEDFGPRWSIALAIAVAIAPLVLFIAIITARERGILI